VARWFSQFERLRDEHRIVIAEIHRVADDQVIATGALRTAPPVGDRAVLRAALTRGRVGRGRSPLHERSGRARAPRPLAIPVSARLATSRPPSRRATARSVRCRSPRPQRSRAA
jgi:hypothetical protein